MVKIKPKLNTLIKISDQISLIGTSHLDKTSTQKVSDFIQQLHPHVVMIELDAEEYQSFVDEQAQTPIDKNHKLTQTEDTDLMEVIGNLQQAFGDLLHITPGSELFGAVREAKTLGIKVEFIDLPFQITLQRLHQAKIKIKQEQDKLTENINQQSFDEKELKSFLSELHNAEVIDQLVKELKRQYPELYQVLFTERNMYMIDQVWQYHILNPEDTLLIVVGGAHMRDLIFLIQKKLTDAK